MDDEPRGVDTAAARADAWLVRYSGGARSRLELLAIPYAGGSCTIFRRWPAGLPADVGLVGVQLPGRGANLGSAPHRRMNELVVELAACVEPLLDDRTVLFGHCMGGVVAFELARYLKQRLGWEPRQLVVSAARTPHLPLEGSPISHLPDHELVQRLRSMNGTPKDLLDQAQLLKLMLPTIRADFALCETYRYERGAPLSTPIAVMAGKDDRFSRRDLRAWKRETTGSFRLDWFAGDHFFISTHEREVLSHLSALVSSMR